MTFDLPKYSSLISFDWYSCSADRSKTLSSLVNLSVSSSACCLDRPRPPVTVFAAPAVPHNLAFVVKNRFDVYLSTDEVWAAIFFLIDRTRGFVTDPQHKLLVLTLFKKIFKLFEHITLCRGDNDAVIFVTELAASHTWITMSTCDLFFRLFLLLLTYIKKIRTGTDSLQIKCVFASLWYICAQITNNQPLSLYWLFTI